MNRQFLYLFASREKALPNKRSELGHQGARYGNSLIHLPSPRTPVAQPFNDRARDTPKTCLAHRGLNGLGTDNKEERVPVSRRNTDIFFTELQELRTS